MDIALAIVTDPQTGARNFDFALSSHDLAQDYGLQTAISLSLFNDRQAAMDDRIPGAADPTDPRGWWADQYFSASAKLASNDRLGSRFWLLEGAPQTSATARLACAYAREALQWLVDGKIATALNISTKWTARDAMALYVTVVKQGARGAPVNYEFVWNPSFAGLGLTPDPMYRDLPLLLDTEAGASIITESGTPLKA